MNRIAALMAFLFAACFTHGGEQRVYSSPAAQSLLETIFPRKMIASGLTFGHTEIRAFDEVSSVDALREIYIRGSHIDDNSQNEVEFQRYPIESPYFWWAQRSHNSEMNLNDSELSSVTDDVVLLSRSFSEITSIVERALLQRDIYQLYSILYLARIRMPNRSSSLNRAMREIEGIWNDLLFDEIDVENLKRTVADRKCFVEIERGEGEIWNIPVNSSEEMGSSWTKLDFFVGIGKHFTDYRGRSFVKVFVNIPGMNEFQVREFWSHLYQKYGNTLHVTGNTPALPAGTATLLVRTFGIFLRDGSYVDTGIPEEVLVRGFRYERPMFDSLSADKKGTMFYQYKLDRFALIRDGENIIYSVDLNAPQFFGFFGDSPDPRNSLSTTLTTMRVNCIACHSELLYGTSTVFSFEHNPDGREPHQYELAKFLDHDRIWLNTPECRNLFGGALTRD